MDHRDPEPLRVTRTVERDPLARRARIVALVGLLDLREQLHQRRLAGAVLARDDVNLAGEDVEVDAVDRHDAGEVLDHPTESDDRIPSHGGEWFPEPGLDKPVLGLRSCSRGSMR